MPQARPVKMSRTVSIAPMMDWTTRHCRYFFRLLSRRVPLYTEMLTTGALIHGDRDRFLAYHPSEHPVALQVGGSTPADLARCAVFAQERGYDEVNLNVGCPSDRVQSGRFGACLMDAPELVADCVAAMRSAVKIPVTVKTRLGIDDRDSYEALTGFVEHVRDAGCQTIILHARKAWLQGLSPKENREIPPLEYSKVYALKQDYPALEIIINGGFVALDHIGEQLHKVDGVMIGRAAYQNPYLLAQIDKAFFDATQPPPSRLQVLRRYARYAREELARGARLGDLTRHLLGLFQGQPGARTWRRYLSENAHRRGAGAQVIEQAVEAMAVRPRMVSA